MHRILCSASYAAVCLAYSATIYAATPVPAVGKVTGTIADALGRPVAGAAVSLRTDSAQTAGNTNAGPNGTFEIPDVPAGTYAVSVTAPGFEAGSAVVTVNTPGAASVEIVLRKAEALDVEISAKRLERARNGLSPETGSSVYRIGQADVQAMPEGEHTALNQVLLQAPGVVQDSFGQLHVRGDHADLQYRINGIIIPEPISGFGQSFDTRIIDQVNLLTGALPAQYGYRTAGIVDIHTKSGMAGQGGSIDVFGGSHGTAQSGGNVFGSQGPLSYYFSGSAGRNDLGIEAPTSNGSPLHDTTRQANAFGYLSYLVSPSMRVSAFFGTTSNQFQIPNSPGLPTNFVLNGRTDFDSSTLDERQSELNQFAVVALQGTYGDALDYQVAYFTRYSRAQFNPDPVGDLLFNGVASRDFRSNWANGLQGDTTYRLSEHHTLRAGIFLDEERAVSANSVTVFPAADGVQTSDQPFAIDDNSRKTGHLYGLYLQDEWKLSDSVTLNYGVRYDKVNEYVNASQLSPRIGMVYQATPSTTLHAGYARYFTPPTFELVAPTTVARFDGTTNQAANGQNSPVQAERDHYFDLGVSQRVTSSVTVGVDAYYKKATNLLDEGQFGAALIFTPFNYQTGKVYGIELTSSYKAPRLSAYLNLAVSRATGQGIISGQFNFDPNELAYIATHQVKLDHDQRVTASFGVAYDLAASTYMINGLVGSGLRRGFANTDRLPYYAQFSIGVVHHFSSPFFGKVDGRIVLVNALDRNYQLRDGSSIGVGAPQFGPRRAIYAGVTRNF